MAQQLEHLKWINGTSFMVDGFNFQNARCKNYFLTHFHSDHTTGLNRSFSSGVIYTSPITATLLTKDMGMPAERVIPLPMDTPIVIDGVSVTLMDANHCPGACMMLFKVPNKTGKPEVILHTGDMRWQPRLADHPALKACKVELLYLDTTYCLPKHVFPSQNNAIASLVKVMREAHAAERKTLFVVGSYHIGKERAFFGAARALGFKIWCHPAKKKVMQWCEMPKADMDCLVSKESAAQIHVSFMGQGLQPEALELRRLKGDYAKIVAFRPTGWSYQKKGLQTRREGNVTIYGIPYSEHSSFAELRNCIQLLRPKRIIPTVNCPDPASARAIVDRFADLMDLSKDKSRLDSYFGRTASAPADTLAAAASRFCSESAVKLDSPLAESAGCSHQAEVLLTDNDHSHQHAPYEATGIADTDDIKWEDNCDDGPQWESGLTADLQGPSGLTRVASDGSDCCLMLEQLLPMRSKPAAQHAHSAPASLSQAASPSVSKPTKDDASEVARLDTGQASEPDPWADNDVGVSASCHVVANTSLVGHAQQQHARLEQPLPNPACEQQRQTPDAWSGAQEAGSCLEAAGVVSDGQHCSSLLDSVDVAEQSRILCQIQQQHLYTKQCLTSKKRQMTLGCFVAPKRLK